MLFKKKGNKMKEKIKKNLETNDNENTIIKSLRNAAKAIHSDIGLPPKKKKFK